MVLPKKAADKLGGEKDKQENMDFFLKSLFRGWIFMQNGKFCFGHTLSVSGR